MRIQLTPANVELTNLALGYLHGERLRWLPCRSHFRWWPFWVCDLYEMSFSRLNTNSRDFSAYFGNQQFTTSHLIFLYNVVALQVHWDWVSCAVIRRLSL